MGICHKSKLKHEMRFASESLAISYYKYSVF